MIVVFVPDLLYSIKSAFDQNVISTYDLYSGFSTGYGPRLVPYSRALFKLISVTCEMAESMRLAAVVPLNPAKKSYGRIVVKICFYRINSTKFVLYDCT